MTNEGIRDHLLEIYEAHGQLTPDLVLEAARPKTHPLHGYIFDRTPKEAAEAWYRERAHELITVARITYETTDGHPRKIRAFHALRTEEGHVYEPAEKIADDPFLRAMLLRDMEREWKQMYRRYGEFEEFVQMVMAAVAA